MPKGTRDSSAVYPTLFSAKKGVSQEEQSYTHLKGGKDASVKGKHLRNIVGDEKANALMAADAANPKNRAGKRGVKAEYSFGEVRNPDSKARAKSAAKAKSTVDTAMDEAIEMVKKKKTANRSAY